MDENRSFAEVRQRLREIEDQSIASRLQEEEFNKYYNHNRQYRRVVGEDTKHSIREQANEDEFAHRKRIEIIRKIAESDEKIARRLQQKFEEEERERLEQQVRMDAELAKALADDEVQNTNFTARATFPLQPHSHSLPTSTAFVHPSDNYESSKEGPFSSATSFSDTLRVNADDYPREHISSQTNSSWESGQSSTLHTTQRERSHNDKYAPPYQNPCTSSSSQRPPMYSASASDSSSEFGSPPPSDLALGRRQ